jgi:hypothetical protein
MSDPRYPLDLDERLRSFGDAERGTGLPHPAELRRQGDRRRRSAIAAAVLATAAIAAGGAVAGSALLGNRTAAPVPAGPTAVLHTPTSVTPSPSAGASSPSASSPSASSSTPTPSPATSSSPSASGGANAAASRTIPGIGTFELPTGFTARQTLDGTNAQVDGKINEWCLTRPGGPWPCAVRIGWGDYVAGAEGKAFTSGQRGAWSQATDVQPCPVAGSKAWAVNTGQLPSVSVEQVGPKRWEVDRYDVTCAAANGAPAESFTSTIYWLPQTRLLVQDLVGDPDFRTVLESIRFTSGG